MRSKVEHVFQVMKLKFGFVKLRYRGFEQERASAVCDLRVGQFVSQSSEAADGERVDESRLDGRRRSQEGLGHQPSIARVLDSHRQKFTYSGSP